MRTKLAILTASLITIGATARLIAPFLGWDQLQERSPYIIIAHCGKPIPLSGPTINAPNSDSSIDVLLVLKGTNNVNSARLWTDYELRQGENYLIFAYYDTGIYQAYEEYRVIPLGVRFSTNSIAGKPLNEQLQILFKQRVDDLNREIQSDEVEKQRLEGGIKKP